MKYFFFTAVAIMLTVSAAAQKGLYIGLETGLKYDFYDYVDNDARSFNHLAMNAVVGGYVGHKWNSYSLETGFYGYYMSAPYLDFDSLTGIPSQTGASSGFSGNWVIPVRFGKEFTFRNGRFFLKPEVGFLTMIATENYPDHYMGTSGNRISIFDDPSDPPLRDSMTINHYMTTKYKFAIESSLSGGVRIKKHFDIYLKGTFTSGFTNTMFNTIKYDSPYKHITAISTTRNSMIYQIGVRYNF